MSETGLSRRQSLRLGVAALGGVAGVAAPQPAHAATAWRACKAPVSYQGVPPDSFLDQLLSWGRKAPREVFEVNPYSDVYGYLYDELGPWDTTDYIGHRRAVMLEALRVLAAFESSWDWREGKDPYNTSLNPVTWEAGAFQVSFDSMGNPHSEMLVRFARSHGVADNVAKFRSRTMRDHQFACGFVARLVRITIRHHGPLIRGTVAAHVSRAAVREFRQHLAAS